MHGNTLKTAVLMAALSVLILLAGAVFGGAPGLAIAMVSAFAMNTIAYFLSDRIALTAMRARPVSEVEHPSLYRIVRELSTSARQPMPRLYVSPAMQPNAFATGRGPRTAAVCCTEGLLRLLDKRELRGVLGHELSHVHSRDVLISSIAAGLATVITFIAGLAWLLPFGSDDDDGNGVIGLLLMLVLGPVAAAVIQLSISRTREYQADASGAALTGDPLALASALRKIAAGIAALPLPASGQLAAAGHLMIANPFRGDGLARLFSTHPPAAERIMRLEAMGGYPR
ncbi:MAG: zinc metalloprotease HtpX [Micromonosporaceae bacterium]